MKCLILQAAAQDTSWGNFAHVKDVATVAGVIFALITFRITQRITRKQARASTMIQVLNTYLKTSEYKRDAYDKEKQAYVLLYWTSLMDLHWTQYNLWNNGYIADEAMESWSYSKYHNYNDDAGITVKDSTFTNADGTPKNIITYKDVWDMLVRQEYFPPDDSFITVMEQIYSINAQTPLEIKKVIKLQLAEHKKNHLRQ